MAFFLKIKYLYMKVCLYVSFEEGHTHSLFLWFVHQVDYSHNQKLQLPIYFSFSILYYPSMHTTNYCINWNIPIHDCSSIPITMTLSFFMPGMMITRIPIQTSFPMTTSDTRIHCCPIGISVRSILCVRVRLLTSGSLITIRDCRLMFSI